VPISVSDPIGFAMPFRTAMMPAIVVVETAPRPTSSMPSFPSADLIDDACVTTENYIIRRMFGWFRTAAPARETGVAMVDPRAGNSLLVIGTAHPRLAATCAAVTGLNGRAVIVGRGAIEQKVAEEAAAAAGALVEFVDAPAAMLPLDTDTFDVVVVAQRTDITHANDPAIFAEAFRVAKPAGRVIIVTGEKRAGIFGALQGATPAPKPEVVVAALKAAGGVAVRRLAGVEGVSYFEARKPR